MNVAVFRSVVKRCVFWFLLLAFPLLLLELGAALFLALQEGKGGATLLLERFPAQVRMSSRELRKAFPTLSPIRRAGQYLGFRFDPVMGFRGLDAVERYGSGPKEGEFLVVTLGGSTTVGDNWPRYLIGEAEALGVREHLTVVNAGLWGYDSFNERILLSSWILPMLKAEGRSPDLVLSLDGVNDIWYRILGYKESLRGESEWYPQYHGYHQQHDNDMAEIRTVGGAAHQLLANSAELLYRGMVRVLPYTMKLVEFALKGGTPAGGGGARAVPGTETLPPSVESRVIEAYRQTLLDLYGAAAVRDIPFVGYLQPVRSPRYHPFPPPEGHLYSGIDYMGLSIHSTAGRFTRLGIPTLIDTDGLYLSAERMYHELETGHSGHFTSLIALFQDNPDTAALYQRDGIHYAPLGRRLIARAVIEDLVARRLLHAGPREAKNEDAK